MSKSPVDQGMQALGIMVLAAVIAVIVIGFIMAFADMTDKSVKLYDARAERAQQVRSKCKVVGFYGKSGQHAVYDCGDGKLIKENEL